MPSLERDDVEASLKRKGFVEENRDHRFFKLFVNGKYTGIYTKTSYGKKYKSLGKSLVSDMAKQLYLTTKQFESLVDCTLSGEGYLELLRQRGELLDDDGTGAKST